MWPAGNEEFIEIARARRRHEAIILATLLSGIGIRTAGEDLSIEVAKGDFGAALDRLRAAARDGLETRESYGEVGRLADRTAAETWVEELSRYRLQSVLWTAGSASVHRVSVPIEDLERARLLLTAAGLAGEAELSPSRLQSAPEARRRSFFERIFRPIP